VGQSPEDKAPPGKQILFPVKKSILSKGGRGAYQKKCIRRNDNGDLIKKDRMVQEIARARENTGKDEVIPMIESHTTRNGGGSSCSSNRHNVKTGGNY